MIDRLGFQKKATNCAEAQNFRPLDRRLIGRSRKGNTGMPLLSQPLERYH